LSALARPYSTAPAALDLERLRAANVNLAATAIGLRRRLVVLNVADDAVLPVADAIGTERIVARSASGSLVSVLLVLLHGLLR
jgi:hypothetical protein